MTQVFELFGAMTIENRWLSIEEIGEYLGVKRDTLKRWIREKEMPAHKVGRSWKFKMNEVDDWVKSGKAGESED
jgi:excisionase family DNA binding protein